MKKICMILVLFSAVALKAQEFLRTDGINIVNDQGEHVILRGIGLGGWMLQEGYMMKTSSFAPTQHELKANIRQLIGEQNTQTFYDAWLANHCRKADIDSMAAWGFNSVRLAMHYNLFTLPIEEEPLAGEHTWLETGFELTDQLLSWCADNNMYLILDLHAAPGGQGRDAAISDYDDSKPSLWESEANQAKTVALWKKLAERYADEPWIGAYDLINETNWDMAGNIPLKNLYLQITTAIREVDQNHIIVIEGNWFANDFTGLTPPWDDNMIYSFHKYWSYNTKATITDYLVMRAAYGTPIWCGEAGENSNVWFTDAIKLFEENNIGWAWWPLKKLDSVTGPLSIRIPPGYQDLLNYWSGSGSKPSANAAFQALMQLAENAKIENCVYQKDVVDAMIRQVQTTETKPFSANTVPGTIFATDFDLGRHESAYFDTDFADYHISTGGDWGAWNNGSAYRNDAVDIESCSDQKTNGYNVGWTADGEWMLYTIEVEKSDSYQVKLRAASANGGAVIRLLVDNQQLLQPVSVTSTNGWQNWATFDVGELYLPKGMHKIKLEVIRSGGNLNYIEFVALNTGVRDEIKLNHNQLFQNFPNPFGDKTTIAYRLNHATRVELSLFDMAGSKLRTLVNEVKPAGKNAFDLIADSLPSGVYLYKIETDQFTSSRKLTIVR